MTKEKGLLSLRHIDLRFNERIAKCLIRNSVCHVVFESGRLFYANFLHRYAFEEISVPHGHDIHDIFGDYEGNHLVVSTKDGRNYYLCQSLGEFKYISSCEGLIDFVIFYETSACTFGAAICIGRTVHVIYVQGGEIMSFEEVYRFWTDIDSILFERSDGVSIVTVCVKNRLYLVCERGDISLKKLLERLDPNSCYIVHDNVEIYVDSSELGVFEFGDSNRSNSLCWIINKRFVYCVLIFRDAKEDEKCVEMKSFVDLGDTFSSVCLHQKYIFAVFHKKIIAIHPCRGEIISEGAVKFSGISKLLYDSLSKRCWIYTPENIYEIIYYREEKNIENETGEENGFQKQMSVLHKASQCFSSRKYMESAYLYSQVCDADFLEICRKFLSLDSKKPLQRYLTELLKGGSEISSETLSEWIFKLILCRRVIVKKFIPSSHNDLKPNRTPRHKDVMSEISELVDILRCKGVSEQGYRDLRNIAFEYGDFHAVETFMHKFGDYKGLVSFYIYHFNYKLAVEMIFKLNLSELYYKYLHVLVKVVPDEIIERFKNDQSLDPIRLAKHLMVCGNQGDISFEKTVEFIECLCMDRPCNVGDQRCLFSYLFHLYVNGGLDDKLLQLLQNFSHLLDLDSCLFTCRSMGKVKAEILIHGIMEHYSIASKMSLDIGEIELSKEYANRETEVFVRKRLWIKIIENIVFQKKDSKMLAELLRESEVVSLYDLAWCFKSYKNVNLLQKEMVKLAKARKDDIERFGHEVGKKDSPDGFSNDVLEINKEDLCCHCKSSLFSRSFYMFRCGHGYHERCYMGKEMSGKHQDVHEGISCYLCSGLAIDTISEGFSGNNDNSRLWKL